MTKGPEAKFRKTICDELLKCNAKIINNTQYVGKTKSGAILFTEPGISDVIMIHKYTGTVFLEFKGIRGVLSPIQKRFAQEVNERALYSAFVVREVIDVMNPYFIGQLEYGNVYTYFKSALDIIKIIQGKKGI